MVICLSFLKNRRSKKKCMTYVYEMNGKKYKLPNAEHVVNYT